MGSDIALALKRRAGRLRERGVHLGGDDLCQRCLAEPRWPGQQYVVKRLAALDRGRDRDRQLLAQDLLADEVLQPAGSQRAILVAIFVGQHGRVRQARLERAHRRALRSACAISCSVDSRSASASSPSTSSAP